MANKLVAYATARPLKYTPAVCPSVCPSSILSSLFLNGWSYRRVSWRKWKVLAFRCAFLRFRPNSATGKWPNFGRNTQKLWFFIQNMSKNEIFITHSNRWAIGAFSCFTNTSLFLKQSIYFFKISCRSKHWNEKTKQWNNAPIPCK